MKTSAFLLALSLAASTAFAQATRVPSPAEADRNLKAAEKQLAAAVAAADAKAPPMRDKLAASNADWRKRVEAGCSTDDGSSLAGTAAARAYAIETQCTADATLDRARFVREVSGT